MSLNTHINCLKQIGILEVKIGIKVAGLHKSLCAWNLGHSWGYELHRFFQQHPFQGNIKDASPHCISGGAFFPVYIPPSIFSPDSLPNSWNSTLVCLRDHHGDRFGTIFRDSSQEGSWASLARQSPIGRLHFIVFATQLQIVPWTPLFPIPHVAYGYWPVLVLVNRWITCMKVWGLCVSAYLSLTASHCAIVRRLRKHTFCIMPIYPSPCYCSIWILLILYFC